MAVLQMDSQDVLHLVFVEALDTGGVADFLSGGHLYYTRSLDDGANWSPPLEIGVPANLKTYPNLAISEDGQTLHVCWSDDNGSGGVTRDIKVATSTNGGATFGVPANVGATGTEFYCRVARGLNGEVYVASASYFGIIPPPVGSDIHFSKSIDGGMSFSAPVTVNSDTNFDQLFPFMSVDSLGRIDIVWSSNTDGAGGPADTLYHSRSLDNGGSFSPNTPIAGSVAQSLIMGLGLVQDPSGRLHLLYLSDVNNPGVSYDIFYRRAE
jgi:hypothetical protein